MSTKQKTQIKIKKPDGSFVSSNMAFSNKDYVFNSKDEAANWLISVSQAGYERQGNFMVPADKKCLIVELVEAQNANN